MAPRQEIAKLLQEYRQASSDEERIGVLLFLERVIQADDNAALELLVSLTGSNAAGAVCDVAGKIIDRVKKRLFHPPAPGQDAPSPVAAQASDESLTKFIEALSQKDSVFRLKAVQAALKVNLFESVPHLMARARIEKDERVLAALLKAIGTLGDNAVYEFLHEHLVKEDPTIRAAALEGLDALDDPRKYESFISLLGDEENQVRALAVRALGSFGKEKMLATLARMASDPLKETRKSTFHLLQSMNDPEIPKLLNRLSKDAEPEIRFEALGIRGKKGDDQLLLMAEGAIQTGDQSAIEEAMFGLEAYRSNKEILSDKRGHAKALMAKLRARMQGKSAEDLAFMPDFVAVTEIRTPDQAAKELAAIGRLKAQREKKEKVRAMLEGEDPDAEPVEKSSRRPEPGQRHSGAEGILSRQTWITRYAVIFRVIAGFIVLWCCYAYLKPVVEGALFGASVDKVHYTLDTISRQILANKRSIRGKGKSLDELIELSLREVPTDPWGKTYQGDEFWNKIYSRGQDRFHSTTWVLETLPSGKINGNDEIPKYLGLDRPGTLWVTVGEDDLSYTYRLSADGTAPSDITTVDRPHIPIAPALTNDGIRAAYSVEQLDHRMAIFVGEPTLRIGREVGSPEGDNTKPTWSATGDFLAYESRRDIDGEAGPWLILYNVGSEREKAFIKRGSAGFPRFHPSKPILAYCRNPITAAPSIRYMDLAARKDKAFPGEPSGRSLCWAKGSLVFVRVSKEGVEEAVVKASLTDGSQSTLLSNDSLNGPIAVSPDGKRLAFVLRQPEGFSLEVLSLETRERRKILLSIWPVTNLSWLRAKER